MTFGRNIESQVNPVNFTRIFRVLVVLCLLITSFAQGFAQKNGTILISGFVSVQDLGDNIEVPTGEASLKLYIRDSLVEDIELSRSGAFDFRLQPGINYDLECIKKGYSTKMIHFNLYNVTTAMLNRTNSYFDLSVNLLSSEYLYGEDKTSTVHYAIYWDDFYGGLHYSEDEVAKYWEKIDSLAAEYGRAETDEVSKSMAQYMASFKEGVSWPTAMSDTLDIAIYKDYGLYVNMIKQRKVNPLMANMGVKFISDSLQLKALNPDSTNLLFIGAESDVKSSALMKKFAGNTLLVSRTANKDQQTMINFKTSGGKAIFEINEAQMEGRGFVVSDLLKLMAEQKAPNSEFQNSITKAQQSLNQEKSKVANLETKQVKLIKEKEELVKTQEQLDSLVKAKNVEIDSFANVIASAETRLRNLNNNLNARSAALAQTQKDLESKQAILDKATKDIEAKEAALAEFNATLLETDKEIKLAKSQLGLTNELLDTQKNINIFVSIVLGAMLFLLYFVIRGNVKQRALIKEVESKSKKIDLQRIQLEEKNTEVRDSINYAKRIQEAMLPKLSLVKSHFDQSFILYEPKDIVAGDFFWMKERGDTVYFAVADCTGHGVPGAMMSVLCHNAMDRALRSSEVISPNVLLTLTRQYLIEQLDVSDGMDIALCAVNKKTNELQYSGAHNPIWIISSHKYEQFDMTAITTLENGDNLYEIKADKQPVGKYAASKSFSNHIVQLHEGDSLYIFSDGFQDQFGGKSGKKMKRSLFKELIATMQDQEEMEAQKEFLSEYFVNWKGDLEQVDDVCVMGVKV